MPGGGVVEDDLVDLLAGANAVYWLRALTEERHLAAGPAYREYRAFIASDGLWARLRRMAPA